MRDGCILCDLEQITKWHYADAVVIVCDCLTCGIPMLVFRRHGTPSEQERMHTQQVIRERYGERLVNIRTEARLIKSHEHWHLYLKENKNDDKTR